MLSSQWESVDDGQSEAVFSSQLTAELPLSLSAIVHSAAGPRYLLHSEAVFPYRLLNYSSISVMLIQLGTRDYSSMALSSDAKAMTSSTGRSVLS